MPRRPGLGRLALLIGARGKVSREPVRELDEPPRGDLGRHSSGAGSAPEQLGEIALLLGRERREALLELVDQLVEPAHGMSPQRIATRQHAASSVA